MSKKDVGWKIEIEEILLLVIILLNFFDAIELLPITFDYIKKIISWAALGYLFYKIKLSKVVFGTRDKKIDFMIIGGFFLILIKDLVSYAMSAANEGPSLLQPFFMVLIENARQIEIFGIFAGLFFLFAATINMVMKKPIKGPSIMHIIHEEGPIPQSFKELIPRLFSGLLILVAFYIIIFNLVMEWLAIAIDAPLLMIALAFYFFFILKHHKKFKTNLFLSKFGNFGNKFYKDLITKLTYKKTILKVLFAMVVLHIATESLHFIWPYVFGIADPLYFSLLNTIHPSLFQILASDGVSMFFFDKFLVLIGLLANTFAVLFLLIMPGYIWYLIYKNKKLKFNRTEIGFIVSSLIIFFLAPAFKFKVLTNKLLTGVDIIGQSIIQNSVLSISIVLLLAFGIGLLSSLACAKKRVKNMFIQVITLIIQVCFTMYITLFSYSVSHYYIKTIISLIKYQNYILAAIFIVFFLITISFYILGTYSFLKDTTIHAKEHLKAE